VIEVKTLSASFAQVDAGGDLARRRPWMPWRILTCKEEASFFEFEFPPPRPDQALLGWRRGQVKNKSNDPAAYHQSEASKDGFGSQSQFGFNILKNKEVLVPGRGPVSS